MKILQKDFSLIDISGWNIEGGHCTTTRTHTHTHTCVYIKLKKDYLSATSAPNYTEHSSHLLVETALLSTLPSLSSLFGLPSFMQGFSFVQDVFVPVMQLKLVSSSSATLPFSFPPLVPVFLLGTLPKPKKVEEALNTSNLCLSCFLSVKVGSVLDGCEDSSGARKGEGPWESGGGKGRRASGSGKM